MRLLLRFHTSGWAVAGDGEYEWLWAEDGGVGAKADCGFVAAAVGGGDWEGWSAQEEAERDSTRARGEWKEDEVVWIFFFLFCVSIWGVCSILSFGCFCVTHFLAWDNSLSTPMREIQPEFASGFARW